jgi:hypothetical protein
MQLSSSKAESSYIEAAQSRNDENTDSSILEGIKYYAHLFQMSAPFPLA